MPHKSETRDWVRFVSAVVFVLRAIKAVKAIWLDPFGMLDPQVMVNLHPHETLPTAASLQVDSGLQLNLEIALSGASVKVKPLNQLFSPAKSALKRRVT